MLPSDAVLTETGRFVSHPWLCDANGHLNTRHYQAFFDDACYHLLGHCGYFGTGSDGIGVADVRCTTDYIAEVPPGTLVVMSSGFKVIGNKSFTSRHEMRSVDGLILFATCEIVTVFLDLGARRSAPIPDKFRAKAEYLLGQAA